MLDLIIKSLFRKGALYAVIGAAMVSLVVQSWPERSVPMVPYSESDETPSKERIPSADEVCRLSLDCQISTIYSIARRLEEGQQAERFPFFFWSIFFAILGVVIDRAFSDNESRPKGERHDDTAK